jgi:hypothetical protein
MQEAIWNILTLQSVADQESPLVLVFLGAVLDGSYTKIKPRTAMKI